ncbi:hypothetical protein GGI21_003099, partial [Coemansia aciculifera]
MAAEEEQEENVARQNSGKGRSGNLFRGLKRVAKAVKSAASSTLDGSAMDDRQTLSPRQRSMSQQTHALSPMARVFSDHQQVHSRSIDLPRGVSAGHLPTGSEESRGLRRGNTMAAHRSPALSQSSINSSYAAPASYEAPPTGYPQLEAALLTARSADAVFGAQGASLSRPAFAMYPQQQQQQLPLQRDRSMTLPSNAGDRAVPALPPRKSSIMSQPVSPQTPGKISLDISGSPLFKPAAAHQNQEQKAGSHSAGESIHKQAVRNISMADIEGEIPIDKISLLLPPPAVGGGGGGHRQHGMSLSSEDDMANTPLSRILLAGGAAHATTVMSDDGMDSNGGEGVENDSGVMVDNGSQSKEALSQSRTGSQTSLSILQQTRSRLESPPSPFLFGHSRYSLVNQDG